MRDDKTRLSYWFPLIEAAGLPVPKTRIIHLENDDLVRAFDGEEPTCLPGLIAQIRDAAAEVGGAPFFLRTDFTSGKHDWEQTCFVDDVEKVGSHVIELAEYSHLVDLMGLPTDTWVVREMLNTRPLFTAFHGSMPITREFRFFVRDGAIDHVQAYWPAAAFKDQRIATHDGTPWCGMPWRQRLAAASKISGRERAELSRMTKAANAAVPGFWSVDWLETVDRGFVLIDMAEGEKSYRWGDE